MSAGIKTLEILKRNDKAAYKYLNKLSEKLVNGIVEAGRNAGHDICGDYIGGMFGFFFTNGPVKTFNDACKSDTKKFAKFHRAMLEKGIYLAPSQFEAGFICIKAYCRRY